MHYCTTHNRWYDDYCTSCFEEQQDGWDFFINPKQEEVDIELLEPPYIPTQEELKGEDEEMDEEPWWKFFNPNTLLARKDDEDLWCP